MSVLLVVTFACSYASGTVIMVPPPGDMIFSAPEILVGEVVLEEDSAFLEIQAVVRGQGVVGGRREIFPYAHQKMRRPLHFLGERDGQSIVLFGKPTDSGGVELIWGQGSVWPPSRGNRLPHSFEECLTLVHQVLEFHQRAGKNGTAVGEVLLKDFREPVGALAVVIYLSGFGARDFPNSWWPRSMRRTLGETLDPGVHGTPPLIEQLLSDDPLWPASVMTEFYLSIAAGGGELSEAAFRRAVLILESRKLIGKGEVETLGDLERAVAECRPTLRRFEEEEVRRNSN